MGPGDTTEPGWGQEPEATTEDDPQYDINDGTDVGCDYDPNDGNSGVWSNDD